MIDTRSDSISMIRGMRMLCMFLLLLPASVMAGELSPFTTDGCSLFPDGTIKQKELWEPCCIRHDFAYWRGGTEEERQQADEALKACVTSVGEPEVGEIMHAGVRAGGSPYLPTPFRWGYGWPYARGYQALSKEEEEQVQQQIKALELPFRDLIEEDGDVDVIKRLSAGCNVSEMTH